MKYLFVKEFNPSYDRFLMEYFKEHGLGLAENTSFKELENKVSHLNREKMSTEERLLTYYAKDWGSHPECRPSLYKFLDKALGGKGRPDLDKMRQLESKLPATQGKLLFTKEEVAAEISGFYRKYMRNPLKSDIEKDASDKRLAAYLSASDLRPSAVGHSPNEKSRRRDVYQIAVELLSWLKGASSQRVGRDLDRIIKEHESNPEHMRESTGILPGRVERQKVCQHQLGYLDLHVYEDLEDGAVTAFLIPSRGFLVSDIVLEEGWNDVVFPQYYILQAQKTRSDFQQNGENTVTKVN